MAKKKSAHEALGGIILIALGLIVWLITVVFKALEYVHENLVQFGSTPIGLLVIFFVLLGLVSYLMRLFLMRGVRRDEALLHEDREEFESLCFERTKTFQSEVAKSERAFQRKELQLNERNKDLEKRKKHFNAEVETKVNAGIQDEKARMNDYLLQHDKDIQKANSRFQRLIDSSYNFKIKTLLNGLTLKNQHTKWAQLRKEADKYIDIQEDIAALTLEDKSEWDSVAEEFKDRIELLEKAQEEKEAQAELKRQMREEKQRQDELERRQREAEEEENRLAEQRRMIEDALAQAEGQYKEELEKQRLELEQQITDVHAQYERAKSMAQLTKQGHVYVISNIGSFGEEVFKVGMTRRLEPMDRVKELGDASVPFEFDVHAMISCDDAPALENALHAELSKYRMNKINLRKEFFKVELQQIIDAVERNHGVIEYVADPIALQYYRSLEMDTENVAA